MSDYYWTQHARENLKKRSEIKEAWVIDTIKNPDADEVVTDSRGEKIYYYKRFTEFGDRVLKVVTANSNPIRIITFHFHRGLKGKI
jgi:hypothetical protein